MHTRVGATTYGLERCDKLTSGGWSQPLSCLCPDKGRSESAVLGPALDGNDPGFHVLVSVFPVAVTLSVALKGRVGSIPCGRVCRELELTRPG
jgi:hypothetical protein